MNITQEETGKLSAVVKINLKEEDYIEKVNTQLKDYRKKAQMPGFRRGMVPMGMIKKMYGRAVMADEVNKAVSDALNNYLVDNKINVLGSPLPNEEKTTLIDFDNQKDFDFFFDIGISPEIEVNISEEIKVPHYNIQVTEDEVEKALKDTQKRLGKDEPVEESGENEKLSGTFYEVNAEGTRVEEGYSQEASFEISEIKSDAEKVKLMGIHKGDKVNFKPSEAFQNDDKVKNILKLKDNDDKLKASFEFEVSDITTLVEAELNEELFNQIYPSDELKTEEDFKERIRKELSEHYQKDADKQFVSDTIDVILEQVNPELPDEFLKRWLLDSNEGKVTKEQLEEQYENYSKTFKWQLIENKLVEAFGEVLKVGKEDVRNKVKSYFQIPDGAPSNPQVDGIVDQLLSNEQEYQRIYGELMDERYIVFFKEKIGKDEKDVTTDEFIKIISTPKN